MPKATPARRLPARPQLRAPVTLNFCHTLVGTLADDIAEACGTLEKKGGVDKSEREQVKSGVGY